jgi:GTP-binding protein HflX
MARVLLVQLELPRGLAQEDLEELRFLAESAGAEVAGAIVGRRQKPDAGLFIGRGKAEELRQMVERERIDLVVVNHELSPVQERNLERAISCRVLDRSGLILDIFALRARSHEGKLQVELAQLERLATRLVRGWTHLERQKGGIGLRGPGETQLETDRRLIRDRIRRLGQRLERVRAQRGLRRKTRRKVPIPTVSLVGYTNAGKSSLFNRLTGADVYQADQLFATLDPTMRRLELEGKRDVILADTVGFIRHLPHTLVEAFKSTLEEVAQADLLVHVVDASNPEHQELMQQVEQVLDEIGARDLPTLVVFNKIDLLDEAPRLERDGHGRIRKVWLSAHTGAGVDLLRQALAEHFRGRRLFRSLSLPPQAGRLHARIHQRCEVIREQASAAGGWLMDLSLDDDELHWLEQQEEFREEYLVGTAGTELATAVP